MLPEEPLRIDELTEMVSTGAEALCMSAGNTGIWKSKMIKLFPRLTDSSQSEEILNYVNVRADELIKMGKTIIKYQGKEITLTPAGIFQVNQKSPGSPVPKNNIVMPHQKTNIIKALMRNWIIPAIIASILIGAWFTRWETAATKTSSSSNIVNKWVRDRWTDSVYMERYASNGVTRTPANNSQTNKATTIWEWAIVIDGVWLIIAYCNGLKDAKEETSIKL